MIGTVVERPSLVDRLAERAGLSKKQRASMADRQVFDLVRDACDRRLPADTSERLAQVSAGCRATIERHRSRRSRGFGAVDGPGWSAPGATDDSGPDGAVVEARDILRAHVGVAVEDGRDALSRAERAIQAGDTPRALRLLTVADTELGQIRELKEQTDSLLVRAGEQIASLRWALWEANLTPIAIADAHGVIWTRGRGSLREGA